MYMVKKFRKRIVRFKAINIDVVHLKVIVEKLPKIRHLFIPKVLVADEVNLEKLQAAQYDQEYVNHQAPRKDAVYLVLLDRPQDYSANER